MIFVSGQVAQLVERSPEKAGVGGSIPSLATTPTFAKHSALTRLFFYQCQICAVNCPDQSILSALVFRGPLATRLEKRAVKTEPLVRRTIRLA